MAAGRRWGKLGVTSTLVILFVLALAPGAGASPTASGLHAVRLPASVSGLDDVSCIARQACIAVGSEGSGTSEEGVVLTSSDAVHWTAIAIPGTTALFGVSCVGQSRCVAVGTSGSNLGVIVASSGLGSWHTVTAPSGTTTLDSVSCSGVTCVAGGSVLTANRYLTSVVGSSDGGLTWGTRALPATPSEVFSVVCDRPSDCWAVGSGAFVSADGGRTWQSRQPPDGCAGSTALCAPTWSELDAVTFTDPSDGWVAGGEQCGGQGVTQCPGAMLRTTDGGSSWTEWSATDARSDPFVDGVACLPNGSCAAVAQTFSATDVLAAPDGSTWSSVGHVEAALTAIACLTPKTCVAVGSRDKSGYLATTTPFAGKPGSSTGSNATSSHRSSLALALIPIGSAFPLDRHTLLDALISLAAMVLVTFPAQLFNRTLEENRDEIRTLVLRRAPVLLKARRLLRRMRTRSGAVGFAAVLLLGSLIGGFNDPTFGLNAKSAETLVAVVACFVAMVAVQSACSVTYRRTHKLDAGWRLNAVPDGLAVAVVCVAVSRATHFEPGYLYGVIAGVAFATELERPARGREAAIGSIAVLGAAIAAWAPWSLLTHSASGSNPDPLVLIVDTFLAGLFVSGVVGTVINLVPLEFLPGAAIARWNKFAWGAVFTVAVFLLVEVMLLPAARNSRLGDAPLVTTLALFALFGGLSVASNRYFVHRKEARDARADAGESDEGAVDHGEAIPDAKPSPLPVPDA